MAETGESVGIFHPGIRDATRTIPSIRCVPAPADAVIEATASYRSPRQRGREKPERAPLKTAEDNLDGMKKTGLPASHQPKLENSEVVLRYLSSSFSSVELENREERMSSPAASKGRLHKPKQIIPLSFF